MATTVPDFIFNPFVAVALRTYLSKIGPAYGAVLSRTPPRRSRATDDLMSALGQKRTYAAQQPMSALPPIATAKADIGKPSCPLYPQKRTCAVHQLMSALGQKQRCPFLSTARTAQCYALAGRNGAIT